MLAKGVGGGSQGGAAAAVKSRTVPAALNKINMSLFDSSLGMKSPRGAAEAKGDDYDGTDSEVEAINVGKYPQYLAKKRAENKSTQPQLPTSSAPPKRKPPDEGAAGGRATPSSCPSASKKQKQGEEVSLDDVTFEMGV